MAFITHYLKKQRSGWFALCVSLAMLGLFSHAVQAQPVPAESISLKLEQSEDALWLTSQIKLDLPAVVEDALQKGITIFFVAEADVFKERWYWSSKKIATAQRHIRLAYQPLTRRWRVNIALGDITESALGLSLNQNFESLQEALSAVRRITSWKIADLTDIEPGVKHAVEFRFKLDLAQLPRPLQIGTVGQSDWSISLSVTQPLTLETKK
jgi:hypothetical protein